jgi:hypothetical protein
MHSCHCPLFASLVGAAAHPFVLAHARTVMKCDFVDTTHFTSTLWSRSCSSKRLHVSHAQKPQTAFHHLLLKLVRMKARCMSQLQYTNPNGRTTCIDHDMSSCTSLSRGATAPADSAGQCSRPACRAIHPSVHAHARTQGAACLQVDELTCTALQYGTEQHEHGCGLT